MEASRGGQTKSYGRAKTATTTMVPCRAGAGCIGRQVLAGELAAVGAAIDTITRAGGRPCALPRAHIANQAGVSTATYDKAMRKARDVGLVKRLTRRGPAHCPSLYEMPCGG
jgi:hypothetical protein